MSDQNNHKVASLLRKKVEVLGWLTESYSEWKSSVRDEFNQVLEEWQKKLTAEMQRYNTRNIPEDRLLGSEPLHHTLLRRQ